MDAQSIITQVCREDTFSNPPSCISKVEAKTPVTAVNSNASNKSSQGGFLSRLLCCFRPGVSQSSETLHFNNHASNLNGSSRTYTKHHQKSLLKAVTEGNTGKVCLVVDLDETLVHSSFTPVKNADFIIPVEIEGVNHQVYVLKRPHVDEFLQRIGELFECVLFTASLGKYADPVTDLLDKWSVFKARLFRESCVYHMGNYVKDLSLLGRDVDRVVIVDNSPISYLFHPRNALPVLSWFEDPSDNELRDLLPFLEQLAASNDIYQLLNSQQLSVHRQQLKNQQLSSVSKEAFYSAAANTRSLNATFSPTPISMAGATDHVDVRDSFGNIGNNININNSRNNATNSNKNGRSSSNDENSNNNNINDNDNNSNNNKENNINNNDIESTTNTTNTTNVGDGVSEVSLDMNNVKFAGGKKSKKKMIAEMIVDGNKQMNGAAVVQQQQQVTQQQQTIATTIKTKDVLNVNNNTKNSPTHLNNNKIHNNDQPSNNKLDQQLTPVLRTQQQHKTSAPELQHLSTQQHQRQQQQQRNSYQPISNPLHKHHISSISSSNVHT